MALLLEPTDSQSKWAPDPALYHDPIPSEDQGAPIPSEITVIT